MKEKIANTALENLRKHTGIEGIYTTNQKKGLDGEVDLIFQNGKEQFLVEVKREIRNHQLPLIKEIAGNTENFLLIAETIFPKTKEELRKLGIGYLDTAGNIFLQTGKHHLWIEGHKNIKTNTEKPNRTFKAAGLKVIFLFLTDDNLLNQPQRTIAEEAGIALGNINYILSELKEMKFLIEKNRKELQLIDKNELLQKWMIGFEEKLKPALHIGNFRFAKTDDERNWKQLKLKQQETFWGGEPAGDMITHYLQPEIFTIYTEETRNNLIKNYHLVPEQNGNIRVYKKFWKDHNGFNEAVVHPILAYTDLINTGDSRCIETAKMIYDKHIKQNL
jgi:hypothetical protein